MKQTRRLALRREALADLSGTELRAAAGNALFSAVGPTCDFFECLKETLFTNCGCRTRSWDCQESPR